MIKLKSIIIRAFVVSNKQFNILVDLLELREHL